MRKSGISPGVATPSRSLAPVFAAAPALPLHTAGPYVAAAYITFMAIILIYVVIMAHRLTRTQRSLRQLERELADERRARSHARDAEPEHERQAVG